MKFYILIYFMFYIYVLRINFYSNLFWRNLFDVISVYLYLFIIIIISKYYILIIVYIYIMWSNHRDRF